MTTSTRDLVEGRLDEEKVDDTAPQATTDVANDAPALLPSEENAEFQSRWETRASRARAARRCSPVSSPSVTTGSPPTSR